MATQRVTFPIYELSCGGGGALTIERALTHTTGVIYVYVNPTTEMAYVRYDSAQVDPDGLVAAIKRTGFDAGTPSLR
jgi:copper chaperone CopZ